MRTRRTVRPMRVIAADVDVCAQMVKKDADSKCLGLAFHCNSGGGGGEACPNKGVGGVINRLEGPSCQILDNDVFQKC